MKKIFLFAALTSIVLASCQKEAPVASVAQNEGQQEITFSALSKAMTKGVLGSGASFETGLGETDPTHRTIIVAGTMVKDGGVVDFLPATTFARTAANKWQAAEWQTSAYTPKPVYYPIGGQDSDFHFLAYSEVQDIDPAQTKPSTTRWYSDSEVEIYVDDKSQYNEIVYSGFTGNKDGVATATFKHSQAIVSVAIKAKDAAIAGTELKINKIGFKDVKTSGTLLLKYDASQGAAPYATAQWLFNAGCTCKFADMGDMKIKFGTSEELTTAKEFDFEKVVATSDADALGYKLTATGFQLDKLFPAQELAAKTMVVNYTLGNLTTEIELPLDGASNHHAEEYTWEAGKNYKYTITVNLQEITINPSSVSAWSVEETSGEYDYVATT